MTNQYKMLNGLCVPVSTPENYFISADRSWWELQRIKADLVRNQAESRRLYYAMTSGIIETDYL